MGAEGGGDNEIKTVQKDSVNTSRPCASLTTMQSSRVVMFASLFQFSNNSRGKPACLFFILRKVPSVLPYSLTLSRHVTTKWYRGKCPPLFASEHNGSIIGL